MIPIKRLSGAALAVIAAAMLLSSCAVEQRPPEAPRPLPAPIMAPSFGGEGSYVVQRGDSLSGVARKFGVPARAVIDANGLKPPFTLQIGQRLVLPQQKTHTVEPGETLFGISKRYGVDSSVLVQLNKLEPPYAIRSGMVLQLPAPPTPEPPSTPAGSSQRSGGVDVAALPAPGGSVAGAGAASSGFAPPPPAVMPQPAPTLPPALAPPAPEMPPAAVQPALVQPALVQPATASPATAPGPTPESPPPSSPAASAPSQPAQPSVGGPPPPAVEPAPEAQRTAVTPPRAPPPRAGRTFQWPVKGRVIATFGPQARGIHNDGMNIAAPRGTPIRAAENGEVAYDGDGIKALGNLLLIRHADGYMTAYAHAETLLVKKGDVVRRGQVIARVGDSGGVSEPQLHFEIRQGAQAIDPQPLMGTPGAS